MTTAPPPSRTWVVVASRDHARRGVELGFVMANHGKRAPLERMAVGDGILVYSARTAYPAGDPLQAITVVGTVTGPEVEPSPVIEGGFRRRADLREIEPVPLSRMREHLPTSRLRFGSFRLPGEDARAIWALVPPP